MSQSSVATPPADDGGLSHIVLPVLFVIIYGSGFVGAKYGLPYCEPLTFLALRFVIAGSVIALIALATGAPWPKSWQEAGRIAIAGMLTVATFSVGVFVAINLGISPALSALVIALQPILVAAFARRVLGEKITTPQWIGLAMGLVGVAFVVAHKVRFSPDNIFALGMCVIALLGLSFGNIYQKRNCSNMNIFTGGAIQSGASCLVCLPLALIFETMQVTWDPKFLGALGYMSIGVSCGALSLLYIMIKRGEVSKVASIFYLVPVSAAIVSYFLYDEKIDLQVAFGISIIAVGVILANRQVAK